MTYKLDIGCGVYKREGFTGVDIDPDTNPDIVASMDNIPLPDGSVAEIWSSHSLEHISKFEVVPVLKEWRRLLQVGGIAVIEVPDLEWCIRNWLWRKSTDWHLDTIFGQQTSPGECHRTGFSPEILANYIKEAGLTLLSITMIDSHGQPTIQATVTKPVE